MREHNASRRLLRRAPHRARVGVAASACVILSLAGCGGTSAPKAVATTSTTSAPTTTTTIASTSISRPGYTAAKAQWEGTWFVSASAAHSAYAQAIGDLESGETADQGTTTAYGAAIGELTDLAALPVASSTAAEQREGAEDAAFVDAFFGITPHAQALLVHAGPSGASFLAAARAFDQEPSSFVHGIVFGPAAACATDLREAVAGGGSPALYDAAVEDVRTLEASPRTMLIATALDPQSPDGEAIAYLNSYFALGVEHAGATPGFTSVLVDPTP